MPRTWHEEFQHSRDEYLRDKHADDVPAKCDVCGLYVDDGRPGMELAEECCCLRCPGCGETDDGYMAKHGHKVCHDCYVAAAEYMGEGDR